MSEFTFKDNQAEDVGLIINVFMLEYFIMQDFVERWMHPLLLYVPVVCGSDVGDTPGTYSDALDSPVTYF
jgi:hypothetical protein